MKINDIDAGFIELVKSQKHYNYNTYLVRGSTYIEDDIKMVNIEKDRERKPRDSSVASHNATNELAKNKFGYSIRNGLFMYVTHDVGKMTSIYGALRIFVPIDSKHIMFCNPRIRDFYTTMDNGSVTIEEYVRDVREVSNLDDVGNGEVMGFGEFISISIDFAMKHNLFNIKQHNKEMNTLSKLPNDELLSKFKRAGSIKSQDEISEIASRNYTTSEVEKLSYLIFANKIYTDSSVLSVILKSPFLRFLCCIRAAEDQEYKLIKKFVSGFEIESENFTPEEISIMRSYEAYLRDLHYDDEDPKAAKLLSSITEYVEVL